MLTLAINQRRLVLQSADGVPRSGLFRIRARRRTEGSNWKLKSHVNDSTYYSTQIPCCFIRSQSPSSLTSTFSSQSMTSSSACNRRKMIDEKKLMYNRDTGIISKFVKGDSSSISNKAMPIYQSVIGIEIHAQLCTPTKLFSSSPTKHHTLLSSHHANNNKTNTTVSPFDIAYPGTLPLPSSTAIQYATLTAKALSCHINTISRFERKHYHYADLPLGFQITQQRWPLASDGVLTCRRYMEKSVANNDTGAADIDNQHMKRKRGQGRRRGRGPECSNDSRDTNEHGMQANQLEKNIAPLSKFVTVGIDRIQIEQDTGKTITSYQSSTKNTVSHVDFNRAGSALVEIVFRPDIRSSHEAASVVSALQSLLKFIGTCDGKMEDGSLRCDLNVSIAPYQPTTAHTNDNSKKEEGEKVESENPFQKYLPPDTGQRVEVKNLNSIRQIILAAEYEALRQAHIRLTEDDNNGHPGVDDTGDANLKINNNKNTKKYMLKRETRTFDMSSKKTVKIRDKGGAVDYRFLPEPDLPPLILNEQVFNGKSLDQFLSDSLPELPEEATTRLMKQYKLKEDLALVITSDRAAIAMYEDAIQSTFHFLKEDSLNAVGEVKESAAKQTNADSYNTTQLAESGSSNGQTAINYPVSLQNSPVDAKRLGELVALILQGTISTTQGKKILALMSREKVNNTTTSSPRDIAKSKGWRVISNLEELRNLCRSVVLDPKNDAQLEQYRKGGKYVHKIKKFFVGKIMAESGGNAHPERMNVALREILEEAVPDIKC